jgi:RNA polymerase sigma-70 factor (ECF subfamily)
VSGWIAEARTGSGQALGQLLETCRQYLLLVANQQLPPDLRPKVAPSDLVQETFLKAQGNFGRFQGATKEELLAWLRRILLNHLANTARHFQTSGRRLGREVALEEGSTVAARTNGVADPALTPSAEASAREKSAALHLALAQLPEHYRQVIRWRNWEKLSFAEIGERTGRSADAARMLWARAVEQLQQFLESPDEPP